MMIATNLHLLHTTGYTDSLACHSDLCNALETFRQTMGVVPSPVKWQLAVVNLDDSIIFSRRTDEHVKYVYTVL